MIRRYRDEDREAVVEVWYAASLLATPFLDDDFLAAEKEAIRKVYLPNADTWVYERTGALVGFLSMLGDEVGAIFVDPESQGEGVGRALMDHAVSLAGEVFLDVFRDNAIGRRFYDAYGFQFDHEYRHEATGRAMLRLVYPARG